MSNERWSLSLEPPVLLPGQRVRAAVTLTPDRDRDHRGVTIALRCVEQWRYDTTETDRDANGVTTTRTVTRTGREELANLQLVASPPGHLTAGQPQTWHAEFDVPGLGPATFEGEELRCDWTLSANVDLAMAIDERGEWSVPVAQPMALLRAGVLDTGMYGLFDEAPANVDAHPAQIRLDPVPIALQSPFSGSFTVETAAPLAVQEVRLELRAKVQVTVSGGRHEEITIWQGRLDAPSGTFGGSLATHEFKADAPGAWLPSIDLPHGRARGEFHVILAIAWEPDIHFVRDVALATTDQL